jgi:hypothetical protein
VFWSFPTAVGFFRINVRILKYTVNKVSSLRDWAGSVIDNLQSSSVYFVRSLIRKIPALTDKSRRDDTLLTVYFSIRIQCTDTIAGTGRHSGDKPGQQNIYMLFISRT